MCIMKISTISNKQNFEGKLIVKNAISPQQKYLFNLHKGALEKQIKDMPFDLFVEQSKSKKTISLCTNVEGANTYIVRKNEQDFEKAANFAISDGMKKSEAYKKMVKANEILNFVKMHMYYVISGEFKKAREVSKELAKAAVKDFEIYKSMTNFRITNIPPEAGKTLFLNSIKYKIYRAFIPKTEEEKQLYKMNKDYLKELKSKNIKPKPVEIELPRI